jgi:hypothetical protein
VTPDNLVLSKTPWKNSLVMARFGRQVHPALLD